MGSFIEATARIRQGVRGDLSVMSTAYTTTGDVDDEEWWFREQPKKQDVDLVWFRAPASSNWAIARCATSRDVSRKLIIASFNELLQELSELGRAYAVLNRELAYAPTFPEVSDPVANWLFFLHQEWSDCVELWRDAPVETCTPPGFEGRQWAVDENDDLNRYWPPQEIVEVETTVGRSTIRDVVLASRMAAAFLAGRVAEWESRALEQHWYPNGPEEQSITVDEIQNLTNTGANRNLSNRQDSARVPQRRSLAKEKLTAVLRATILEIYRSGRYDEAPSNGEIAKQCELSRSTVDRRVRTLFGIDGFGKPRALFEQLWRERKLKDFVERGILGLGAESIKTHLKKLDASD